MAEQSHCYFCFDLLAASLSRSSRPPLRLSEIEEALRRRELSRSEKHQTQTLYKTITGQKGASEVSEASPTPRPLFVTWNIYKSGTKHLRGCIGTFENQELEDGLKNYALTSAFDDTRFNPIEPKELSSLECGVSILTDFEPASHPMDWTLGVHGLRISFIYHHRRLGATYLPDVPLEQGWSKEDTVISLMRKAGWSGRRNEWQKIDLNVIRYKGTKASVDYADYKTFLEYMENLDIGTIRQEISNNGRGE